MQEELVIPARATSVPPNLADYAAARASFRWADARAQLDGLPGGGFNIAHEALDRHARGPRAEHVALRWLGKRGEREGLTYAELTRRASRFANALAALGVPRGETVFALSPRIPDLYAMALGTLRHGAVFCPLFSAFGPEPIASRLSLGHAKALFTTERLYQRKVAGIRGRVPSLEHVIVIGDDRGATRVEGCHDYRTLVDAQSPEHTIATTEPETPALLHFTSGTTGAPKGALHVHEAVVMHHHTGRIALDLHPADVFFCTADPGWVTGTSYGILAPLTHGVTMVVDEAEMDVERWYDLLEREQVTVWYTAPTAIRMLMKAGDASPRKRDLSALRFMASVGEPLNPEAVTWSQEVFGHPFHDNWWQTETGGIMIANYASMSVKPGSMGKPLPGVEAALVRRDEAGLRILDGPDEEGELALRVGWPSMMRAYLDAPERYAKCFADGWYLSGDLAKRDADGYYWFVGRADDVIKSAGHLIGPFEVESALIEHEAVAEAGVIGKPDPVAGAVVKAFVSLRDGFEDSPELRKSLMAHARGKIMRRLLKARELGLPEGDTSTLEGSEP